MAHKDTSKQWFETGDFPTQAQFAQVFDWQRWKDETIAFEDLSVTMQNIILSFSGTVQALTGASADFRYTIPAGYLLEKVIVKPSADCNASLEYQGTDTPGDIILTEPVTSLKGVPWIVNVMAFVDTTVVLQGVPDGSIVYFIKRKIV